MSSRSFGAITLIVGGEVTLDQRWNATKAPYRSHVHLVYEILSGACSIEVDGTWHELGPGSLCLLTANHWHRRRVGGAMAKRFFHFRLASLGMDLALQRTTCIHHIPPSALWREAMTDNVGLWDGAYQMRPDAPITPRWRLEAMIQHLVASLLPEAPAGDNDPLLARALAHLDSRYLRRPTVAAVAAAAGCSERTLSARFQHTFGIPVASYAERRRMEEAERLLKTTATPIADLAVACGYPDPQHFSRVVRRHFGRSPRELRHDTG